MTDRTDVFHAIADPARRVLLDALLGGERRAGELGALLDVSQPAISQHLRVLREAGLVVDRREGRTRLYSLRREALDPVERWLDPHRAFWDEKLGALARHLDRPRH